MVKVMLSSFMAILGFGVLFNIRGKNLFYASFIGSISSAVYFLLPKYFDASVFLAMFMASIVLSCFSEYYARKLKTPVTTFIICGLIPLVPGGGMYYTMLECVKGDVITALSKGLETLSIAGSLALGIVFVSTFTRFYFEKKQITEKN